MGTATVLGLLGILVSLSFGAWGVFLAIESRYPGEITFIKERVIALFDAIVKDLPELAVLYMQAPVSPNVVLIRGSLVNTGKKDISPTMIERPITVSLPNGSKWLSVKVVSASPNVEASLDIQKSSSMVLTNGLLRRNEFIRFQAMAELAPVESAPGQPKAIALEDRLEASMKFEHRIEDTRAVRSLELQGADRLSRRLKGSVVFFFTIVMIMCAATGFFGIPKTFSYRLRATNNETVLVTVSSNRDGSLTARSLDGKQTKRMTVEDFFSKCQGHPTVIQDRFVAYLAPIFVLYVLLPSLLVVWTLRRQWVNKRLRRLLMLEGGPSPKQVYRGPVV